MANKAKVNVESNAKDVKKVIATSKVIAKDADLLKSIESMNIDNLVAKAANSRKLWNYDYLNTLSDNNKTARRKVRKLQMNFCKSLLASVKTKTNVEHNLNALHEFSKASLIDIKNYSNVSSKESTENRQIIDFAYHYMFENIKE